MKTKSLLLSFVLTLILFVSTSPQAAPLNATQIGGMWTTTPITTAASQALTGFRGAFTPMNIGMAVGTYVIISTIGDGINTLRAEMGSNLPAAQLPSVQGWADPNTPPSTSSQTLAYMNGSIALSTKEAWCASFKSTNYPTQYGYYLSGNQCNITTVEYPQSCSYTCVQVPSPVASCPAGYTVSGSSCNLTNPSAAQWPSDGIPTLKNIGTAFVPHPRDSDNTGQPSSSNPYTRTGKDSYNNPVKETLTPNAAGGADYQRDTEGISPTTGEPMVQRDKFSTGSDGQVLSKSSTQYANSTINNVNVSNSTSPQIDTSSLAKDSTSQAILTQLQPGTPADLTNVDSAVKTIDDQVQADLTAIPKDLTHNPTSMLQLPNYWNYASGVCYPAEFDAGKFGTVSLDKFCQIYDEHIRSLIVFMFGVLACLHVFHFWKETIIASMPS